MAHQGTQVHVRCAVFSARRHFSWYQLQCDSTLVNAIQNPSHVVYREISCWQTVHFQDTIAFLEYPR